MALSASAASVFTKLARGTERVSQNDLDDACRAAGIGVVLRHGTACLKFRDASVPLSRGDEFYSGKNQGLQRFAKFVLEMAA